MIFADKLIALRKKAGWSQEELAQQLNVSRQSVSKWEGAQSVPDLDKIVQFSRIFGVSTDYLLKTSSRRRRLPNPSPSSPSAAASAWKRRRSISGFGSRPRRGWRWRRFCACSRPSR